jgi:hypothetical protein
VQIDSGFTPSVTNGWQIASSSAYSTNCFTLSIQSFEVDKIVLYPNPSISGLNIEMTQDLKQATIYSILGSEVLKTNSKTIDTSNLKSGMYIINIEDKTGNVSIKRFIKQ